MFSRTNTYVGTKKFNKGMLKERKLIFPLPQHTVDGAGRRKRRAGSAGCLNCIALYPINFLHNTFR